MLELGEWLRFNRNREASAYVEKLDLLKHIAAPVMAHMSKSLANRSDVGVPPTIID